MNDGEKLRRLREDRHLGRNVVAEETGLTVSAIARIETRSSFKEGEYAALVNYYGQDPNAPEGGSEPPTGEAEVNERGDRKYRVWRGVSPGDIVRIIDDEAGRYEFRALVIPGNGTKPYVECVGGAPGYMKARTPGAHKVTTSSGHVLLEEDEEVDA